MSRERAVAIAMAVVLSVAMAPAMPGATMPRAIASEVVASSFLLPSDESLAAAAVLAVSDAPASLETAPTLEQVRDGAAARAAALPESEWDIARLADALDYDPERAFTFVRDSIGLDPYPGVLRGAEGTLAARAGNDWDRALLLAALLGEMEVPFRFAFAELDDASAAVIMDRVFLSPAASLARPGIDLTPMFDPAAIAARASRDYARLRQALGDRVAAMDDAGSVGLLDIVRHHAWVQTAYGGGWRDLDPTLPDSIAGSALAPAATVADEIPAEAYQTVTVTVIAETLTEGTLTETTLLERTMEASAASDSEIFLHFQAAVGGLGGSIVTALSGDEEWIPVLLVDGEGQFGSPFRVGGRGTDVFGEETQAPDLVSLRMVVVQGGPTRDPVVATRVLLDRMPTGLRGSPNVADQLRALPADDGGPLVLGQVHHIMVSTGGADRRDYSIQRSWSADFAGTALTGENALFQYRWSDLLWPVAAADQSLVVASETAVVPVLAEDGRLRSFIDAPRVFIATFGRDARERDAFVFETDLLIDDVALLPRDGVAAGEVARRRLWYGTLETALETEMALGHAALIDPADRSISAVSLSSGGPLTLLTPTDLATLPSGAPGALRQALQDGSFAVVPGDPAATTVWWTIDPATGQARSVLDPGLGGVRGAGSQPALRSGRTMDSSGTTGTGARLTPRTKVQPPPSGGGSYSRGAGCRGGTEQTVSICSFTIPVSWVFLGLGLGVTVILFIVWYAFGPGSGSPSP